MDASTPSRRRFLALASTGAGLSLAGCNEVLDDGPAQTGDGGDGEREVTLVAEPDQAAVQQERVRISQQVQNETIDRQEAQDALRQAQREAAGQAVEEVRSLVADGPVSVEDSLEAQGLLLVSGPANALIDLLSEDPVGGLAAASVFQDVQQRQQLQGNQTVAPPGNQTVEPSGNQTGDGAENRTADPEANQTADPADNQSADGNESAGGETDGS